MLRLERVVFAQLISQTIPGRVLILLGARRVGKTSLLKELATSFDSELVLSLNGEDQATLDRLSIKSVENYRAMLGKVKYLIIDEAQNLTPKQVKGIVTRAGAGTKIILVGDPEQIDNPFLDVRTNGLCYAAEKMKGSSLTYQITLTEEECERSVLAYESAKRM